MSVNERLEGLRRRLQKDPSSIAFAQLAEELRRAGSFTESLEVCRAGLAIHPTYLSARVTLGRALIDLKRIDEAQRELEKVRQSAPENLAAIRALADIHRLGGGRAYSEEGASEEFTETAPVQPVQPPAAAQHVAADPTPMAQDQPPVNAVTAAPAPEPAVPTVPPRTTEPAVRHVPSAPMEPAPSVGDPSRVARHVPPVTLNPRDIRALRTLTALEHWLAAIHVARARRNA